MLPNSRVPDGFTKKISITTNNGSGSAYLRRGGTTEQYKLEIKNLSVSIESNGSWDNERNRSWVIITDGKLSGKNISTSGQLLSSDRTTVIRENCQFSLTRF